ncbi:response regulator [Brevundimonas sp.]|uniref:response regulator n=1 Tax=Brevundimonas sp. TaxID=1871086 RepID=UPI002609271C|nr:response regulator [Brevundimonas sp.]
MHGRWRVFRHETGREAGPPAWAYVALFCASLLIGMWSAHRFGAVVIWPANGILLAAFLQLHRRKAITVLAVCFAVNLASNIVRGDPMPFLWLNAVMNIVEVVIAGVLARRVCGAALDLRRPRRLAFFAIAAVTPAVLFCTLFLVGLAAAMRDYSPGLYLFTLERYFAMEALGLLTIAPILLLLARRHRFADTREVAGAKETIALFSLLTATTLVVFFQSSLPITYLIFPALLLLVLRVSTTGSALAVLLVTVIGGFATVNGHGPVTLQRLAADPELAHLPDLVRQLNVFYGFLLTLIAVALPISTIVSERRRMVLRLKTRTLAAQDARRRAEAADAAKSRFLALMSHEMRTPLHGVVGYAEILSRRSGLPRDARAQVEEIQRSGAALLTLVEDLLEVSHGAVLGDLEAIDPAALLAEVAAASRDSAAAKSLPIHIRVLPGAETPLLADRRRLRQILHRLVSNAVKFTTAGEIVVSIVREGPLTVFRVTDTGPGVDPDLVPSLFDAFAQADDSISRANVGCGIGLAVARRLTGAMGGRIELESTSSEGSTFVVRLPLPLADEAAPTQGSDPALAATDSAARVLIVDDHPTNREVARLMLAPLGCEIFEAVDGLEAVEMASAAPFDLILMDVRMPRMDGLAATQAIRALGGDCARTPILAVTADTMPDDAARCTAAGMDGHVAKPLTHASLFAAIDAAMAGAGADAPIGEAA